MTEHPSLAFHASLADGRTRFIAWQGMPEPMVSGIMARSGVEAVVLDRQHGLMDDVATARGIAEITGAGLPALVRIPVGTFSAASHALDMGAVGVVAPMINSVADARAFASFMKFPPVGGRSWGPLRALGMLGLDGPVYLARANACSMAIAMIETREALAALDDILAVPGIDGVLVGPADLSIGLSNGAHVNPAHPDVDAALAHVIARCRATGKIGCVFAPSAERANAMGRLGFHVVAIANDQLLLGLAMKQALAIAKG